MTKVIDIIKLLLPCWKFVLWLFTTGVVYIFQCKNCLRYLELYFFFPGPFSAQSCQYDGVSRIKCFQKIIYPSCSFAHILVSGQICAFPIMCMFFFYSIMAWMYDQLEIFDISHMEEEYWYLTYPTCCLHSIFMWNISDRWVSAWKT